MRRIEPSEAKVLSNNLKEMGINAVCPDSQKRLALKAIQVHPEEFIWPIPIIEFRSVGTRSHTCDVVNDSMPPSGWYCKCQYFPLDRKYLIVSQEAQKLFGYTEEECIELCAPIVLEDETCTDPPLMSHLIYHEDWHLISQVFVEAILDTKGESTPREVRCVRNKEASLIRCVVRLRLSKSDSYTSNTWNHFANWCFLPIP
jgi:hypothetical protein